MLALDVQPFATTIINNPNNHVMLVIGLLTIMTLLNVVAKDIL